MARAATATTSPDARALAAYCGERYGRHRGQAAFLRDPAKYRAAIAGIGGGKSDVAAFELLRQLVQHPGADALVVAPSYRMIYRAGGPWAVIKRVEQAIWPGKVVIENRALNAMSLHGGSTIWFGYGADPDSLRAAEAAFAWMDEASLCPREAWRILLGRIRQPGNWPHRAWITTTPRGRDWVYDVFVADRGQWSETKRRRYGYHHWTSYDNPGLRGDDLQALEEAYGRGSAWHRQEMLAEFVTFAGVIYAAFDEDAQVVPEPPKPRALRRVVAGVDWGVSSPGCIVVVGEDSDGGLWLLDEVYETGLVTHGHSTGDDWLGRYRGLLRQWPINATYADPADANALLAWQRAGVAVSRANNAILDGIREVQRRLPSLRVVGTNCPNWLAERRQYHWAADRDGEPLPDTRPAPGIDHAMDAFRYAVMGLAGGIDQAQAARSIVLGAAQRPRGYGGAANGR